MKKTIIANWGSSQQGKSETIKRVTKLILQNYPNAVCESINFEVDIKVVITINDIKVGVESTGDPNSRLPESLKLFASVNCDIILCSTRTSGGTVNAVDTLAAENGYNVIWVTNHRSNEYDHQELNQMSAENIYKIFDSVYKDKLKLKLAKAEVAL